MGQEVQNWGVHRAADGVEWLVQARGGMPAFFLKDVQCPFYVRKSPTRICNHMIAPNTPNPAREHQDVFRRLLEEDEVTRLMLPMPKDAILEGHGGAALFRTGDLDDTHKRLITLSCMSSPIRVPIFWMGLIKPAEIMRQLEHTNVQPLVLMGAKSEHAEELARIARASCTLPRRLLVVGDNHMPWRGAEISSTRLHQIAINDLIGLPWEALGSMALRGYMRGEWTGSWFNRDMIPANEYRRPRPD